jgi:hypothetical protein
MKSKLIYLDTNIWNRLVDQKIDPKALLCSLREKDADVVISGETVYELARTFLSPARDALARGQCLFQCVKTCVDAEIPCAHDNMQVLHGEVTALLSKATELVAFYGPTEYTDLRIEVEKLSKGIFDKRAEDFVAGRRRFSQSTRSEQKNHFAGKEHIKQQLKAVSIDKLRGWLDNEMLTDTASAMLASHLLKMYNGVSPENAFLTSRRLLRIPASRVAKGIIRADLYFNWRCANRGSTPNDLVDDLCHVLNASYSEIYATAEPKQADYAPFLLSAWTTVAIYNDDISCRCVVVRPRVGSTSRQTQQNGSDAMRFSVIPQPQVAVPRGPRNDGAFCEGMIAAFKQV